MKVIVAILSPDVVTKSLLFIFYPHLENKNKNQKFFHYSESRTTSKPYRSSIDFYKGIFLHVIPISITVPW